NASSTTPPSSATLIGGPPSAGPNAMNHDQQQQHQMLLGDIGIPQQQQSIPSGGSAGTSTHAYRGQQQSRYDTTNRSSNNRSGGGGYQQYGQVPAPSQRDSSYTREHYHRSSRQGGGGQHKSRSLIETRAIVNAQQCKHRPGIMDATTPYVRGSFDDIMEVAAVNSSRAEYSSSGFYEAIGLGDLARAIRDERLRRSAESYQPKYSWLHRVVNSMAFEAFFGCLII
ncbi:hypothetical protein FOZ63_010224, partial [Perkinsus olseni]